MGHVDDVEESYSAVTLQLASLLPGLGLGSFFGHSAQKLRNSLLAKESFEKSPEAIDRLQS